MSLKNIIEQFKRLPPATQVALVVFALTVVVLLVFFPSAGTSIIAFLVALKMLDNRQWRHIPPVKNRRLVVQP